MTGRRLPFEAQIVECAVQLHHRLFRGTLSKGGARTSLAYGKLLVMEREWYGRVAWCGSLQRACVERLIGCVFRLRVVFEGATVYLYELVARGEVVALARP